MVWDYVLLEILVFVIREENIICWECDFRNLVLKFFCKLYQEFLNNLVRIYSIFLNGDY